MVQEAIINETTEKTTPAVTVERRNKALQSTTTSLPDQMLSVSTFSKVEGNALSKYAYETWGKFSRTTTVQPFENWEVTKWQERVQRLTEKTYELTTWDQLVSCPSGHITSQMVDYEMTTEGPFTEYTPWSAKSSEKLVSLAEDPPVVTESMIATYSKIVLLQKQMLAKFSNVAAGSEAKASMPFAGDKGRHAGRAGTAGASQVRSTLGSGQVKASAAASTLTSYGGAQASAMLASIQQKVQLYATGFNASLVLAQGFVWYQGKSHAVKKVTTQGQNLFSVSFVGPGGNIIEATLKP
ncbi:MAG: hypothetical protein VKO21_10395 [Candidatus Sericytochromatia bacterium]|nr:hypothetical protein [Candidatus Sericytochromatia bacterium]